MYNFSIKYDSGSEKFEGLDHYYGAESLMGFSQALLISLNAFFNDEILTQAPSAKGFRLVLGKSKIGSWEQNIVLHVTRQDVAARINKLGKSAINDLLRWALNGSVGKSTGLTTRRSTIIARELERQNDDLHDHLEGAIKRAHAPVKHQGLKITVSSGRTVVAEFDEATLRHIETEVIDTRQLVVQGAVSRFNARTHTGRIISAIDANSTPFFPESKILTSESIRLADNLSQLTRGNFVPIEMICTRVTSKDGNLKRYQLHSLVPSTRP